MLRRAENLLAGKPLLVDNLLADRPQLADNLLVGRLRLADNLPADMPRQADNLLAGMPRQAGNLLADNRLAGWFAIVNCQREAVQACLLRQLDRLPLESVADLSVRLDCFYWPGQP